jgi:hypothetical protein
MASALTIIHSAATRVLRRSSRSCMNPSRAKFARKPTGAVDGVEGLAEVVGEGAGGGDDVLAGLGLNGAVAPGGLYEFPD